MNSDVEAQRRNIYAERMSRAAMIATGPFLLSVQHLLFSTGTRAVVRIAIHIRSSKMNLVVEDRKSGSIVFSETIDILSTHNILPFRRSDIIGRDAVEKITYLYEKRKYVKADSAYEYSSGRHNSIGSLLDALSSGRHNSIGRLLDALQIRRYNAVRFIGRSVSCGFGIGHSSFCGIRMDYDYCEFYIGDDGDYEDGSFASCRFQHADTNKYTSGERVADDLICEIYESDYSHCQSIRFDARSVVSINRNEDIIDTLLDTNNFN